MLACTRPAGPRLIPEGSLVIVYEGRNAMKAAVAGRGCSYGSRFGNFGTVTWVGLPFGSKVFGANEPHLTTANEKKTFLQWFSCIISASASSIREAR